MLNPSSRTATRVDVYKRQTSISFSGIPAAFTVISASLSNVPFHVLP